MDHEVERKFLFNQERWNLKPQRSSSIEQGYLARTGDWEIRLRRSEAGCRYTMKNGSGLDRGEWEVRLSPTDFDALWDKTEGHRLVKTRDRYEWKGHTIEVDRYGGAHEGLTVAEVEFASPTAARAFSIPGAFGPELTYDPRFKNRALAGGTAPLGGPARGAAGWSFGVLPFVRGASGWELIVVSTRRGDRWIVPKGQPEPGRSAEAVALAEAREEAGLTGRVAGHPLVLPYARDTGVNNLLLFPLRVTGLATKWLESTQRERRTVPLARAVEYGEVARLAALWIEDHVGP